jgi:hypothetical protein
MTTHYPIAAQAILLGLDLAGPPPGLSPQEKVTYVLREHPEARNSDALTILHHWLEFDGLGDVLCGECLGRFAAWLSSDRTTPAETIRRRRQEIQSLGLGAGDLQPAPTVAAYRKQRARQGPPRR